ncbi:MAG: ABC transporter permease [Opitutaceae bacterium]|nr:ABC transporter permease [Opitutaceae bacterium]
MNATHVFTVYVKELRDALRDRRTLISTLLAPTLGIPLIMLIIGAVVSATVKKTQKETPSIMVIGAAQSPAIVQALASSREFRVVPTTDDWEKQIGDKRLKAAVVLPDDFDSRLAGGQPASVGIRHYEGELASGFAVNSLQKFFSEHRTRIIEERLAKIGVSKELTNPYEVDVRNVAAPEKVGGNSVGGLLPYLALIACFAGAMHSAIDLTAGEKERGTLETILSSPLSRLDLVLGKFLLVLTMGLTSVTCMLVSMTVSLSVLAAKLAGAAREGGPATFATLDPAGTFACLVLIVPVAVLASALMLALGIAAKSTKEAQSYLGPLLLVVIIPAMVSTLPGVELNKGLALIPVLNVSLTAKQLVSGVFNWDLLAITFGSCCAYAALALAFCVRQFNRESVLFRY